MLLLCVMGKESTRSEKTLLFFLVINAIKKYISGLRVETIDQSIAANYVIQMDGQNGSRRRKAHYSGDSRTTEYRRRKEALLPDSSDSEDERIPCAPEPKQAKVTLSHYYVCD